ncbi:alpha/beta fold hydrolase [Kibdelosporangium lantanae]|uniref:Alpha/beta fold hydrolase n=1 Tax=Kibdelosporangium lantanae TaxID=1497396 RepID=A0ABW3M1X8_9PSEU
MPDLAGTAGTIHYASWIPTSPRVLAVFNHGLGEHVGLYSPFAEALNDAGIALWAHDHFGHGLSAGTRVLVDNIDHFLDDSLMVLEHARAAHPSLPLVLIGHSLGATLATYYAFSSLALVLNNNAPISTPPVQQLHSLTSSVGDIPLQVFTFLLPCAVVIWLLANRTNYGRRLYAVGTNEAAARFTGLPVVSIRFRAYLLSGLLSAVVAVVTVAQFASARPDAGTVGNGMALPAITIAILGGTAITGGIGRVGGVLLASLFVVWLNAGILLAFEDSRGSQYQLLVLGAVLVLSALLNRVTLRRTRT